MNKHKNHSTKPRLSARQGLQGVLLGLLELWFPFYTIKTSSSAVRKIIAAAIIAFGVLVSLLTGLSGNLVAAISAFLVFATIGIGFLLSDRRLTRRAAASRQARRRTPDP